MKKAAGKPRRPFIHWLERRSPKGLALAGLEALLRLVDHVDAAFTAHDLAIAVTLLERAERVTDLHRSSPIRGARAP